MDFELVLRPPIEITAVTGEVKCDLKCMAAQPIIVPTDDLASNCFPCGCGVDNLGRILSKGAVVSVHEGAARRVCPPVSAIVHLK
jgi:hypothetical protein